MEHITHQERPRFDGRTTSFIQIALGIVLLFFFPNTHESAVLAAPVAAAQASKWVAQLPAGDAKAIIVAKCQFCHTLERVVGSHLPTDGWKESVNRMVDLGTPLDPGEVPSLVDYLAANFGPAGSKPSTISSSDSVRANSPSTTVADALLVDPDQATFSPLPNSMGSMKNVEMFVISGDPLKPSPFSVLLKISAGGILPASWLSGTENTIVCLRGAVQFGEEGNSDASKLQTLKSGAVLHIANQAHELVGHTKDGAVILLYKSGPVSIANK